MSRTHVPGWLRVRVSERAQRRCGYCLTSELIVGTPMEIDHLVPEVLGGRTEEENLWLACPLCNAHKANRILARDPQTGDLTRLFDPRRQIWSEHFRWSDASDQMLGVTAVGRATVAALRLNRPSLVVSRRAWVSVGWHPPLD